jgi:integrase
MTRGAALWSLHVGHRMADYLIRRNGRYSYRRRYPSEVAEVIGRTEFVKALGTADRTEAARLARQVSVKFDNECESALRTIAETPAEAFEPTDEKTPHLSNSDVTQSVLSRLPGIIRMATEFVIAEQAQNTRWKHIVSLQRRALEAHIAGEMPVSIAMHPLEARTALKAIDAAVRGEPMKFPTGHLKPAETIPETMPGACPTHSQNLCQRDFEAALAEYAHGKSHRRKMLAHRQAMRVLHLPCTHQQAVAAISNWCKDALTAGKKPSSVWTEASSVIALLKYVPGWHAFAVPKVGELKQLRGAGAARRDARAPMPVPTLHRVLRSLPLHLPRDGEYWHAVVLVCALYGLRPGEVLRCGAESLQERETVFGGKQLIYRVGLHGAKNLSSERDLPVPPDLRGLFQLALSRKQCNPETAKTRVDRINVLVRKAQGEGAVLHSMYSIRHLFADIARTCGFADAEIGPIMGHKARSGITSVYGGAGTLENESRLLRAVQAKLFPNGLAEFLPASMIATESQ